ncbi:MAG: 30S ribosomal protein S17, partial [Thermoplasmatales archaeon]|nr:30S ribosomal protein S17 [Thermoplasmatales archaeon]
MTEKKEETRNIGLNVKAPSKSCNDRNCPFHGSLSVRGQVLTGVVSSIKMQDSIIVKREYTHRVPKYERYEKRTSTYSAH